MQLENQGDDQRPQIEELEDELKISDVETGSQCARSKIDRFEIQEVVLKCVRFAAAWAEAAQSCVK